MSSSWLGGLAAFSHPTAAPLLCPHPPPPRVSQAQASGFLPTQEYPFLTHGAATSPFITGLLLLNGASPSINISQVMSPIPPSAVIPKMSYLPLYVIISNSFHFALYINI